MLFNHITLIGWYSVSINVYLYYKRPPPPKEPPMVSGYTWRNTTRDIYHTVIDWLVGACIGERGGGDCKRDGSVEYNSSQSAQLSTQRWAGPVVWTRRIQWCHAGRRWPSVPGPQSRTRRYVLASPLATIMSRWAWHGVNNSLETAPEDQDWSSVLLQLICCCLFHKLAPLRTKKKNCIMRILTQYWHMCLWPYKIFVSVFCYHLYRNWCKNYVVCKNEAVDSHILSNAF